MIFSQEIRVLGGLPVTVQYTVARAEPDVGLMDDFVDDIWLLDRRGRRAWWAEKRMTLDDWVNVIHEVIDHHER